MLGEKLGEERGRMVGIRVLSVDANEHKVEVSFQDSGKILGIEYNNLGTYRSVHGNIPPGGVVHGKGQGFLTTTDGEIVTYTGQGVGKPMERGGVSWRGALYCQTQSKKLARLNSVALLFEYEVDENGDYHIKYWEWK